MMFRRETQTIGDTERGDKVKKPGYRVLTEEQLLKLPIHNFLRLYRKVLAYRSYIKNHFGDREQCYEYVGSDYYEDVGQYLTIHDDYLRLLKRVSKQLPSAETGSKLKRTRNRR